MRHAARFAVLGMLTAARAAPFAAAQGTAQQTAQDTAQDTAKGLGGAAKPFGVLLLGEAGDQNWKSAVSDICAKLGAKFPLEFAGGEADSKAMQAGLDRLQALGVKKIVAVPLFLSSISGMMDQDRYLFGIRKEPSKDFLDAPHSLGRDLPLARLQSRVPLVLTKALDDHPLFVDILASRAKALSRDPAKEALLLVAASPGSAKGEKEWLDNEALVAERVRQKAGFRAAGVAELRPDLPQDEREKAESSLRALAKQLGRGTGLIVVPLELVPGYVQLRLERALDGVFYRHDGKTVFPDSRIARWVEETARAGATLPDMRVFKTSGQPAPAALQAMPAPQPKEAGQ